MTPRKEKALQALLVSRTKAEAAARAGIGESTLREIMVNKKESAQARISAARTVLEYSVRLGEQVDILEQLQELERRMEESR